MTASEAQAPTIALPPVRDTRDTVLTMVFLAAALVLSVICSAVGASLILVTGACGAKNGWEWWAWRRGRERARTDQRR